MKKQIIYAGTFDPLHQGHLKLIEKAGEIFDEVWVVVSVNVYKNPQKSLQERYENLTKALNKYPFVVVKQNPDLLTAEYAKKNKIHFLLRGIRNKKDYKHEEYLAKNNQALNPDLQTIFFFADDSEKELSSSAIKEIAKFKKEHPHGKE